MTSTASKTTRLRDALTHAVDLAGDFENEEYVRGMCELIARCFPTRGVTTDIRAEGVEITLRILQEAEK